MFSANPVTDKCTFFDFYLYDAIMSSNKLAHDVNSAIITYEKNPYCTIRGDCLATAGEYFKDSLGYVSYKIYPNQKASGPYIGGDYLDGTIYNTLTICLDYCAPSSGC